MNKIENIYYFFSNVKFLPNDFFNELFSQDGIDVNTTDKNPSLKNKIKTHSPGKKFNYKHKKTSFTFESYIRSMNKEDTVYEVKITFYYKENKRRAAEAFSQLIQEINSSKKSQFYMAPIKDSLSTYLSESLFSELALYEHGLRALILAMYIPIYTDSWTQRLNESVGKDLSIKGNSKEKLEKALEELDLSELETVFFQPHLGIDNNNYDERFNIENLESLQREALIKIIKYNKPLSLWEKEINKYVDIHGPQDRMIRIRNLRNRIAHNKTFSYNNYLNLKKELNSMNAKINEALEKILQERNSKVVIENMNSVNNSLNESMRSIYESTKEISKSMEKIREVIKENIPLENLTKISKIFSESIPKNYFEKIKNNASEWYISPEVNDDEDNLDH